MSRKVLVLANVGNRDVAYKGEGVQPARTRSEELLEDFERVREEIEAPILPAGLGYIESLSHRYPEVLGRGKDAPRVGLSAPTRRMPATGRATP